MLAQNHYYRLTWKIMLLTSMPVVVCLFPLLASVALAAQSPFSVFTFNISESQVWQNYEEEALLYTLQGVANRDAPRLYLYTAGLDFDYPPADEYWAQYLSDEGRAVSFTAVSSSLCTLLHVLTTQVSPPLFGGVVAYNSDGFSLHIAMTVGGLEDLLPMSTTLLERYSSCLPTSVRRVQVDLRQHGWATNIQAYKWAIAELLPLCSLSIVFNADHYHNADWNQGNATLMSADYPVAQRAFIMNLCPLWKCDDLDCKPPSTRRGTPQETELFIQVLSTRDELVSVWGWSDPEHAYTNITSHAGGVVFCTFSTPNLSVWSVLGRLLNTKPLSLPSYDNGHALDVDRVYVAFETNEGDTPRILSSLFTGAWLSPARGSVPIAWAVDPLLAEFFPLLWNYFVVSATHNDTFLTGVDGAGYIFVESLGNHSSAYERRAADVMKRFAPQPTVVDVGVASAFWPATPLDAIAEYVSRSEGVISAVVNACGSHWDQPLNTWLKDGTPVINSVCMGPANNDTSHGHYLYYYRGTLNQSDPVDDLAHRMAWAANKYKVSGRPLFLLLFGGLGVYGGHSDIFDFLTATLATANSLRGAETFVPVGAQELVRLARQAAVEQ